MAPRKRKKPVVGEQNSASLSAPEKIARLLALVVTKGMDTDDAVLKLSGVGFEPQAVAEVLGITPNHVAVVKYKHKSGRKKKAKKKA